VKGKNDWSFRLAVAANISQVLSLLTQVFGMSRGMSSLLNFLILLGITTTGILAALWVILKPRPLAPLASAESKRLSRLTEYAKIVLISILIMFLLYLGFQAYQIISTDKLIVIVTDFSEEGNPASSDRTTSQLIVEKLQQTIGSQGGIEIVPVFESVEDLSSQSAIEIGRRHRATIVIWGWYTVRQNEVLINPRLEILTSDPVLQPFRLDRQIVPRSSFESFDFELALSDEYSYLSAFTIGTIRYSQKRYEDAIESYSRIIEQNETARGISLVYNMRGLSLSNSGRHREALYDYLHAVELSSTDPVYHYNLGSCQLDLGEIDDAVISFERATELGPYHSSPLNSLAVVYHNKGTLVLAEQYYHRAIQLSPGESIYRTNLAGLYIDREEYDQALEQLDVALQTVSMDWYLHSLKADALFAQQRFGLALWEFLLAWYCFAPILLTTLLIIVIGLPTLYIVDIRLKRGLSKWLLLRILFAVGAAILITLGFKRRRSTERRNNIVTRILAFGVRLQFKAHLISGNESEAKSLVEAAISRGIQNTELLTSLGIFYFEQHEFDLAAKVFSETLKLDEHNGHAHFGLGWIHASNGDLPASLLSFQQAISSREYETAAWLLAGDIYWKHKDFRGALFTWGRAAERDPQYVVERTLQKLSNISQLLSPSEHFKLGLAYNRLGNVKNATRGFEIALKQGKYTPIASYAEFRLRSLRQT